MSTRAGMKTFLQREVMPDVRKALTRLSVARPDDPNLWLAKYFLSQSPAGDMYALRRKDQWGVDDDREQLAVRDATEPQSLAGAPRLKPLHPWEKRIRKSTGIAVNAGCQTVQARTDIAVQTVPQIASAGTQTALSSEAALRRLQSEARRESQRRANMHADELAMSWTFSRIARTPDVLHAMEKIFAALPAGATARQIVNDLGTNKSIMKLMATHAARNHLRPMIAQTHLWQSSFLKLETIDSDGRVSMDEFTSFFLAHGVCITRASILRALQEDPLIKAIARYSQNLHPLLVPRSFNKTFTAMNASRTGRLTLSEFMAFMRRARRGARDDAREEAIEELFSILAAGSHDESSVTESRLLMAIQDNESVRAILRWSGALRPLLTPSMWRHTFQRIDIEGTGRLHREQFFAFVREACLSVEEVDEEEKRREEAAMALEAARASAQLRVEQLRQIFELIDVGKTGFISRKDLLLAMSMGNGRLSERISPIAPLHSLLSPKAWADCFSSISMLLLFLNFLPHPQSLKLDNITHNFIMCMLCCCLHFVCG
eukprot:g568.t1